MRPVTFEKPSHKLVQKFFGYGILFFDSGREVVRVEWNALNDIATDDYGPRRGDGGILEDIAIPVVKKR